MALVSSMMEPSALTKFSPDAAGAGRTAVELRLLKSKRAWAGKEESRDSPRTAFLGRLLARKGRSFRAHERAGIRGYSGHKSEPQAVNRGASWRPVPDT